MHGTIERVSCPALDTIRPFASLAMMRRACGEYRCHYRGRLASTNAVFDSSYERGRPLTFKVCHSLFTVKHQCAHLCPPTNEDFAKKVDYKAWQVNLSQTIALVLDPWQVGVREVIAGWDVGILGDADQGIPPMKVRTGCFHQK